MKTSPLRNNARKITVIALSVFITGITTYVQAKDNIHADTSVSAEISRQLNDNRGNANLYFPSSVKRFYTQRAFAPIWTLPQKDQNKTWAAMLLIDCVLQYGLRHEDYHPRQLQYTTLHTILEQPGKISNRQKALFEIMLTDAMLAFTNHLHFGRLNPYYPPQKLDKGTVNGFNAVTVLTNALTTPAFMDAIEKTQPANKDYRQFQHQLHLIKGVYEGDCYKTPEADVKKIAINMERLRWADINDSSYIQVNIPDYTLTFVKPDTSFTFRVIVGKPATPTGTFSTNLTGIAMAGNEHKTPITDKLNYNNLATGRDNLIYLVTDNQGGISLNSSADKSLFRKRARALSGGKIEIERGEELAQLLLSTNGNAAATRLIRKALLNSGVKGVSLKKPLPLRVTYITAAIINGQLVKYNDVYHVDNGLENRFYNQKH